MLEGKNVNVRTLEREDVNYLAECINDIDFMGEYEWGEQVMKSQLMRYFDNPSNMTVLTEVKQFIVQKKDGTRIGLMSHRLHLPHRWSARATLMSIKTKNHMTSSVRVSKGAIQKTLVFSNSKKNLHL